MKKLTEKQQLQLWDEFRDNINKSTPVDKSESAVEKKKRIARLEKDEEAWFKYYFPNFYTSEPAPFHIRSTKRVFDNPELFLTRAWARELAKSARTMMESLKLMLTGVKSTLLLVSNNYDNAERLLTPYQIQLESNNRIINDYGKQQRVGKWESGEFVTKKGASFRALGAGQSPRGTRNDAARPDLILIDDIDTDEECRNKDRIKAKVKWVQEALIPTRSISNPLSIIVCGNVIAKYCTVTELMKLADFNEVVNIRDKHGKSTWPAKNEEPMIDRVLSTVSYNSAQKEYFNNPIVEGDVFKNTNYGKCPPLRSCERVLVYADPATSNKDKKGSSTKAVALIGYKNLKYYVYRVWLDNCSNATFVSWLYEAYSYAKKMKVDTLKVHIENNSLQDPFYEQVILPMITKQAKVHGFYIPITPDKRKKPDKYDRIEGTLEPIHRLGNLVFNVSEKGTQYMNTFEDQWLGVSATSKTMDGPDCIEGGVWLIQNNEIKKETTYRVSARVNRRY